LPSLPSVKKGAAFKEPLKFDPLIDGCLLLELKSAHETLPMQRAQLLRQRKLLDVPLGQWPRFPEIRLVDPRSWMILPGANPP
jgi:hypothetical protein